MQLWIGGIFVFILSALSPLYADARQVLSGYQTGDLIFLDLDCGRTCDAIEQATQIQMKRVYGISTPRISHIGALWKNSNGSYSVLETIEETGVRFTTADEFLSRAKGGLNQPNGYYLLRWKAELRVFAYQAMRRGQKRLKTPYDRTYQDPSRPYCSLLIQQIFLNVNHRAFFDLLPMEFGEAGSEVRKLWEAIAKERNYELPIGKPGISPTGIYAQMLAKGYASNVP